MADRVLVADDDKDIARFIEVNLRLEGFDVVTVHNGAAAVEAALELQPAIVLLDVMMPRLDGYEVTLRLRGDVRTAHIPVILLTARSITTDRVLGFTAGADDYIVKPFDPLELIARVRTTLRRVREMRSVSPLTGLPGNLSIEQELSSRVANQSPMAVVYADLDNFKSFNDRYGFLRGDQVLLAAANALRTAAFELAGPAAFVGHVGGDDFVAVVPPEVVEQFAKSLIANFDAAVPALYDPADAAAGCIEVEDRQGALRRFPLVSISIGIASTARRHFADHREIVQVATELKLLAKRSRGSSYAVDRRGAGDGRRPPG